MKIRFISFVLLTVLNGYITYHIWDALGISILPLCFLVLFYHLRLWLRLSLSVFQHYQNSADENGYLLRYLPASSPPSVEANIFRAASLTAIAAPTVRCNMLGTACGSSALWCDVDVINAYLQKLPSVSNTIKYEKSLCLLCKGI